MNDVYRLPLHGHHRARPTRKPFANEAITVSVHLAIQQHK